MIAVQERLLARRLQPDLVLSVRRQIIEGGDVELEFVRLREFAHACADADQLVAGETFGQLQNRFGDIVDFAVVLAEAVGAVRPVD